MFRPRKKKGCVSGSSTDRKFLAATQDCFFDYEQGVPIVAKNLIHCSLLRLIQSFSVVHNTISRDMAHSQCKNELISCFQAIKRLL